MGVKAVQKTGNTDMTDTKIAFVVDRIFDETAL